MEGKEEAGGRAELATATPAQRTPEQQTGDDYATETEEGQAALQVPPPNLREALLEFLARVHGGGGDGGGGGGGSGSGTTTSDAAAASPVPLEGTTSSPATSSTSSTLPPLPRSVHADTASSSYTPLSFIDAAVADTRTPAALTALYDALEDQYGSRPRLPLSDSLLFGGFHRRFLSADGTTRMQDPTLGSQNMPVLRPEERPAQLSVSHGVFSVYNNAAGEERQVMTARMCEGTFGGGKYPLHYAAYAGDARAVKKLLQKSRWRKSGVDVVVEDNLRGRTPLHVACAAGHREIVEILLKIGGAQLNSVDHWGWSPLMFAVYAGHEDVARFLISSRGAHLSIHGNRGETAHTLSTVEHRGYTLQRKALTKFIRDTEDALTVQSAADGWPCTFGLAVHATRPLPRYQRAMAVFDIDGARLRLKYRAGQFGLRYATRYFNLHRIGWPGDEDSDPDHTSCNAAEARATKAGAAAAMAGHVRGMGRRIEPWMEKCAEGSVIMELVCAGGWVVERNEEEEDADIENETVRKGRVMTQGPRMRRMHGSGSGAKNSRKAEAGLEQTEEDSGSVDAIRLEFPIPKGLHSSFMLRFLDMRVTNGRERALLDLEKDRVDREALKKAMQQGTGFGARLRKMSTRVMSTRRFLRK
jgi:hypothetical protein